MVKLHKFNGVWYLTDKTVEPFEGLYTLYNGVPCMITFIDVVNNNCLINVLGMSKNIELDKIEIIIAEIDKLEVGDILSSINRLEVIDDKGRSYVK